MSSRTAVRRSAAVGLGAVAALALAAPAHALDAGTTLEQATEPVAAVVDPLTAPLQPAEQTVEEAAAPVEEAAAPVIEAVAPQQEAGAPPTEVDPKTGNETPASNNGSPAETAGNPAPGVPAQSAAAQGELAGAGTASMPGSFTASASGLEGFSGRGAGFGTAANPMSLFGAPQVATPPALADSSIPTPLAVTAAGGQLADVLPVDAPEGLPGALVALAATVVGASVAAHVAALRARREGVATA